jgi:SH3-like domain-containing protein
MLVSLLSDRRTAIVKKGEPRTLHVQASESSAVRYRVEAGVVGRLEKCGGGWCLMKVGKNEGYIRTSDVWGVSSDEVIND